MTRDDRPGAGGDWDERSLLLTMLEYTQQTAVMKVKGLSPELARTAPLPTSPRMAPANVLNHLRWVEWSWVHVDILDEPDQGPWTDENPDAEFDEGSELPLDEVIRLYEEEAAATREFFADADLDAVTARKRVIPLTVRWVLLHLIEETARHNGHLDILREMADGEVGD
ncbi:DinB family protein [Aeromicrobium sp.]|uniref:DinB family protein n=1 Tax=Aeromicrobium sp. TaxID=1871063 RepID=UPI003C5B9F7F